MTDKAPPTPAKASGKESRNPPTLELRTANGKQDVIPSGDFDRIRAASRNANVWTGLVFQTVALGSRGRAEDATAANFVVGFVDGMEPRDPAEAVLLTQMATVHQATMMLARRLNHVENLPQQDAAERALNKLARTYATQMEALKRYRDGGQQKMVVEHVTVNAGGQAIVGNVSQGGRGSDEK